MDQYQIFTPSSSTPTTARDTSPGKDRSEGTDVSRWTSTGQGDGRGPCAARSGGGAVHALSRRERRAVAPLRSPLAVFLLPGFQTVPPEVCPANRAVWWATIQGPRERESGYKPHCV